MPIHRYWVQTYQLYNSNVREINAKYNEEIPEHFRHRIPFSPYLEAMPRLASEILEYLLLVEGKAMPMSFTDVDFLKSKVSTLDSSARGVRSEQAFIDSLAFEAYGAQIKSIPDAVSPMFSWAFSTTDSPGQLSSGSELNKWLKHGHGVALVTGETGSGKSMLMKYVSNHPDLDSTLYQWTNPLSIAVASHFFCSPGTPMQRSLQGMLQTLLRVLLLQMPEDIDSVRSKSRRSTTVALLNRQWTVPDLEQQLVTVLSSHSDRKFCFFIDGLDQYDGDIAELARLLQRLLRLGNIKMCLSSTSEDGLWDEITAKHITIPMGSMVLRDDVELYMAERLKCHPLWHTDRGSVWDRVTLSRAIAERSRNLLWGRIAVEHLRNRYRPGQTLADVRGCLTEMPSQLRALVKHCLLATPASVAQMGAYFFLIALEAREPPPLAIYHFVNSEQQERSDYALAITPRATTPQGTSGILHSARQLLEKRCGIFLQVRPDSRVGFPHKAIRDIVNSRDVVTALQAKAFPNHQKASPDQLANLLRLSLARAYLAFMKTTKMSWDMSTSTSTSLRVPSYSRVFGEFLSVACLLDSDSRMHQLLDDWEACLLVKSHADQAQLDEKSRITFSAGQHFRRPVLDALLSVYLDHKLYKHPTYLQVLTSQDSDTAKPVLSLVLTSMFDRRVPWSQRSNHSKMLMCLLRHRHDPNHGWQNGRPQLTPWTHFVSEALAPSNFSWAIHSGFFSIFLDHGANPNALVWGKHPSIFGRPQRLYTSLWVVFVFSISELLRGDEIVLSDADKRSSLDVMNALCTAGASAQTYPSCDFVNSPESCKTTDWAEKLVKHVLDAEDLRSPGVTIGAEFVERILLILVRARLDIEWSWPMLREAVTPSMYDSIEGKVAAEKTKATQNGTTNGTGTSNPGKRASDETGMDEMSPKRARSEAEDETMTTTLTMSVRSETRSA